MEGIVLDDAAWKMFDDYAEKFGLEKPGVPELALQAW